MSEKFIVEGWKLFKGELFSSKQTTLQRLIDEKPYPSALAALQQSKKDQGYTDEWYRRSDLCPSADSGATHSPSAFFRKNQPVAHGKNTAPYLYKTENDCRPQQYGRNKSAP